MPITLPNAKLPATKKSPSKLLIYGPPKVGKTCALAALDNCLIIDLEKGTQHVDALKIEANSLAELEEIAKEIKAKGCPYKYVAIDTIDKVEEWCEGRATTNYRKSVQGKNFTGGSVLTLPNGGGYMWLRAAFHEVIELLRTIAPTVILVGHLRDKMLESKEGKEVTAKDLDLTGKIKSITCSWADAVGYMYRSRDIKGLESLNITFITSESVLCGARPEHLRGKQFAFSTPCKAEDWNSIFVD